MASLLPLVLLGMRTGSFTNHDLKLKIGCDIICEIIGIYGKCGRS